MVHIPPILRIFMDYFIKTTTQEYALRLQTAERAFQTAERAHEASEITTATYERARRACQTENRLHKDVLMSLGILAPLAAESRSRVDSGRGGGGRRGVS